jgi:hypothetical protein
MILALILVCATAVIIVTVLRPNKQTAKLQQTIITILVSLFTGVGGYLARTPEILRKDKRIGNANIALEAFEKKVDELLPPVNAELTGSMTRPNGEDVP